MTIENLPVYIIFFICGFIMIRIGIRQQKSKEPVSFWSGETPPSKEQITDVKAYNKQHGFMWIFYGAGMIIAFLIAGYIADITISMAIILVEAVGGGIIMAQRHKYLEKKYRKI